MKEKLAGPGRAAGGLGLALLSLITLAGTSTGSLPAPVGLAPPGPPSPATVQASLSKAVALLGSPPGLTGTVKVEFIEGAGRPTQLGGYRYSAGQSQPHRIRLHLKNIGDYVSVVGISQAEWKGALVPIILHELLHAHCGHTGVNQHGEYEANSCTHLAFDRYMAGKLCAEIAALLTPNQAGQSVPQPAQDEAWMLCEFLAQREAFWNHEANQEKAKACAEAWATGVFEGLDFPNCAVPGVLDLPPPSEEGSPVLPRPSCEACEE
jgi:hypothetical protein